MDEAGPHNIDIDVFDKDKLGADKLLGSTQLSVPDLQNHGDLDKDWIPLDGAKSGEIQVSTDFTPAGLSDRSGNLPSSVPSSGLQTGPGASSKLGGSRFRFLDTSLRFFNVNE